MRTTTTEMEKRAVAAKTTDDTGDDGEPAISIMMGVSVLHVRVQGRVGVVEYGVSGAVDEMDRRRCGVVDRGGVWLSQSSRIQPLTTWYTIPACNQVRSARIRRGGS